MSSRSWLLYFYQNRFHLSPLSYETLEYAAGFASEQCPEGVVAISTNTLRILALEKLGAVFNQVSHGLRLTPRKFVAHPDTGHIVLIETEYNAYTEETKQARKQQMAEEMVELAGEEEQELAAEMAAQFLQENLPEAAFGSARAGPGMWSSAVKLINPLTGNTLQEFSFPQNEAAFSVAIVQFACQPEAQFVLIGVGNCLRLRPRQSLGGFIYTFLLSPQADHMELIHKTHTDEVVNAIIPFRGRALAGVGRLLRIYDLGKKKLLRKCENKHLPYTVVGLQAMGQRIYVSDVQESVHFVRYKPQENQLIVFADETNQRFVTATTLLDFDTVAVADKFGSLAILRLPQGSIDEVQEDPTGIRALWDKGLLNGATQKCELLAHIYIGETVTNLQKAALVPGGSESLVYTTLSGSVGVLVPFTSREDNEFFQHLEMHLRTEFPPVCGRDHLAFRSYYAPVKNIIDGDLCEQYSLLDTAKQKAVAEDLDRQPSEVAKKLEDIRTRYAF